MAVNGARRRVFRVSDQIAGEREVTGPVGNGDPGRNMREVRWSVCEGAFEIGFWGVVK